MASVVNMGASSRSDGKGSPSPCRRISNRNRDGRPAGPPGLRAWPRPQSMSRRGRWSCAASSGNTSALRAAPARRGQDPADVRGACRRSSKPITRPGFQRDEGEAALLVGKAAAEARK
jgi:hypothetical protein